MADVQVQTQITAAFGSAASSAWGRYANEQQVNAKTSEEAACWSASGACRVAGHSVIGALGGGVAGALGTGLSTSLTPVIAQQIKDAGVTGVAAEALTTAIAAGIGAAAGGTAGAASAYNEVLNNYLTSTQWQALADQRQACNGERTCLDSVNATYTRLSGLQDNALATCDIRGALFSAIAMSGCGGGGGDDSETSAAPAPDEAPATLTAPGTQTAATSAATSAANCPAGVRTFSMTDSVLAGASASVQHEFTTLLFTTPRTAITVKVCVVQNAPSVEFPATPAALSLVLAGAPQYAILADGQFDQLSTKQLGANFIFPANAPERYLNKKLVAYTQDGSGAWVRTVLATTQRPGKYPVPSDMVNIEMVAPITAPGFYTVE
jgi:hypothetical protein